MSPGRSGSPQAAEAKRGGPGVCRGRGHFGAEARADKGTVHTSDSNSGFPFLRGDSSSQTRSQREERPRRAPRMCREHEVLRRQASPPEGSSPRVWGAGSVTCNVTRRAGRLEHFYRLRHSGISRKCSHLRRAAPPGQALSLNAGPGQHRSKRARERDGWAGTRPEALPPCGPHRGKSSPRPTPTEPPVSQDRAAARSGVVPTDAYLNPSHSSSTPASLLVDCGPVRSALMAFRYGGRPILRRLRLSRVLSPRPCPCPGKLCAHSGRKETALAGPPRTHGLRERLGRDGRRGGPWAWRA